MLIGGELSMKSGRTNLVSAAGLTHDLSRFERCGLKSHGQNPLRREIFTKTLKKEKGANKNVDVSVETVELYSVI